MNIIRAAALAVIAILRGLSFWRRDSAGGLILLALHRPDRLEWSWCLSWRRLRPGGMGGWKFYRLGRQQERFGAGTPWGDLELILQHRSAPARDYRLPSAFYCLALVAGLIALAPMGGCAQLTSAYSVLTGAVTQNTLDAARASYNSVLTLAVAYNEVPRCAAGQNPSVLKPCSQYTVVQSIRAVDAKVAAGFDRVQADLNACNGTTYNAHGVVGTCSTVKTDWDAAQSVIAAGQAIAGQIKGAS